MIKGGTPRSCFKVPRITARRRLSRLVFRSTSPHSLNSSCDGGASVVLRLHVDIVRNKGKLASWLHLEPDPKYEPEKHIERYLAKNDIRGETVVGVFGQFYHD